MNINEINYIIKEILNGNKIVSFEKFIEVITLFGIDKVKCNSDAKFIITDKLPNTILGECSGIEYVKINISVIKEMYSSNKLAMSTIFHEIRHFKDNYNIYNHIYDKETIGILKDKLLNYYIDSFTIQLGLGKEYLRTYYHYNYKYILDEIYANKYSYIDMLNYYKEIGVELNESEKEIIRTKLKKILNRKTNKMRNLEHCLCFNSKHLSLDEAFNCAIRDNIEWLEKFPILKKEYYIENCEGKKRVRRK